MEGTLSSFPEEGVHLLPSSHEEEDEELDLIIGPVKIERHAVSQDTRASSIGSKKGVKRKVQVDEELASKMIKKPTMPKLTIPKAHTMQSGVIIGPESESLPMPLVPTTQLETELDLNHEYIPLPESEPDYEPRTESELELAMGLDMETGHTLEGKGEEGGPMECQTHVEEEEVSNWVPLPSNSPSSTILQAHISTAAIPTTTTTAARKPKRSPMSLDVKNSRTTKGVGATTSTLTTTGPDGEHEKGKENDAHSAGDSSKGEDQHLDLDELSKLCKKRIDGARHVRAHREKKKRQEGEIRAATHLLTNTLDAVFPAAVALPVNKDEDPITDEGMGLVQVIMTRDTFDRLRTYCDYLAAHEWMRK